MKMKLFLAESNVYLLQINSLETTVTGIYILWNHYFLESMFALLEKTRLSSKTCESLYKKTWFYNRFLKKGKSFQEGQVFPNRANMDSMKQQQWFYGM